MPSGAGPGETVIGAPGPAASPAGHLRGGDLLGRYTIERVLGAGGMGLVYAARDPDLDRRVAIKVLRGDESAEARARLLREARAMAKLSHPNVITVYEVGTAAAVDFIAMELIDGGTLADRLRGARPAEALRWFRAAGAGLAAAHASGLVHRDFKPANVLVRSDGQVVVTDFGLARAFEGEAASAARPAGAPAGSVALEDTLVATPDPWGRGGDLKASLTRTGAVMGTPAYMAPEQFAGAPVGPAADQFAFAVALWEALAGARPFAGGTYAELRAAVERGVVDAEAVPRAVRPVLVRALARDPAARWPDLPAMLAALDRRARRSRRLWIGAVVGAVVIAGGAAVAARGPARPAPPAASCAIGPDEVARAWNAEVAARLAARFAGVPTWPDFAATLDEFAAAWRRERDAACAAPTAPSYHGQVACLAGLRAELTGALDVMAQLPAGLLGDAVAAELLTPPAVCRSGRRAAMPALPDDPATRDAVSALVTEIATARLMGRSGAPIPDVRHRIDAAIATARKLVDRYPPALAMAVEAKASLAHGYGDCVTALPLYEEAATTAEAAGADGLRAMARLGSLECALTNAPDPAEIERRIEQARAAIQRAGDDPALSAVLDLQVASLEAADGDLGRAIERCATARATFAAIGDVRRAATAARDEGTFRLARGGDGDRAAALARYREALAGFERSPGRGRAETEQMRLRLATALIGDDPVAARAMVREASATLPRVAVPADARVITGRVVDAAGRPVAGATVSAADPLIAGSDGVVVAPAGAPVAEVTTDAAGGFALRADAGALMVATAPGLRSPPVAPGARPSTLRLAPAVAVAVEVHVHAAAPASAGVERAVELARRASVLDLTLTRGPAGRAIVYARDRGDGRWSLDGVAPGAAVLYAQGASWLGDRLLVLRPITVSADPAPVVLDVDLGGVVLDVIVHADRGQIPAAQVLVFPGHPATPPVDVASTWAAMVRAGRVAAGVATPVSDATRTEAGAARYRPGDAHARIGFMPPGPATACVIPMAGDVRDVRYARDAGSGGALEVQCAAFTVGAGPVQVVEVRAPPPKNAP